MDAVKFLEERKRMFKNGNPVPGLDIDILYNTEKVVKIVEEWSAAHPLKARQSAFLEQYPEAAIDVHGVLQICPMAISDTYSVRIQQKGVRTVAASSGCRRSSDG